MQTNLNHLLSVYQTALGELRSGRLKVESTWPIIVAMEQLGYYLEASVKSGKRPALSHADLSRLLYIFETMAMAVEQDQVLEIRDVPEIEGFSNIRLEIELLQEAVRVRGAASS